jgi:hypothetical protein
MIALGTNGHLDAQAADLVRRPVRARQERQAALDGITALAELPMVGEKRT